jgi:hypothetical protein
VRPSTGARGRHAANRGIRARIHHEHQAGVLQVRVQLAVREAGLDRDVHVVGTEAQHLRHARQIDRHAAADGVHVPFERTADAEGDDRRAVPHADLHDGADVFGGLGIHHGIRLSRGVPRLAMAVVVAHGGGRGHTVAQQGAKV